MQVFGYFGSSAGHVSGKILVDVSPRLFDSAR